MKIRNKLLGLAAIPMVLTSLSAHSVISPITGNHVSLTLRTSIYMYDSSPAHLGDQSDRLYVPAGKKLFIRNISCSATVYGDQIVNNEHVKN